MEETGRRRLRKKASDEDDDFFSSFSMDKGGSVDNGGQQAEEPSTATGHTPGKTVAGLSEEEKKKLQQQLIEMMFKYAEQKYGRKKPQKDVSKSTKDDYELYLRSLKVKVKQASDKLNTVIRQKKEIEKKVDDAQKDSDQLNDKLTKAEGEKQSAADENRDPVLPKDFIVPQRSKRLGASLGALVMKASTQDWTAALAQFASTRKAKATGKAPEWNVKRDKTAAILKAGSSSTTATSKPKDDEAANPFNVNLKKTGYVKDEAAS